MKRIGEHDEVKRRDEWRERVAEEWKIRDHDGVQERNEETKAKREKTNNETPLLRLHKKTKKIIPRHHEGAA